MYCVCLVCTVARVLSMVELVGWTCGSAEPQSGGWTRPARSNAIPVSTTWKFPARLKKSFRDRENIAGENRLFLWPCEKRRCEEFSFSWTWKSWLYFRGYVEPGLNGGWAQGNNMKSHLVFFFFAIITMPSSLALTTSQVGWLHKNLWRKNEEVRSWNRIRSCWFQLNEFTKQFVQHTQQVRGLFEDDWWDKHSFTSIIMLSFA